MFAIRKKFGNNPMLGNKCIGFEHRFVQGFCMGGEHIVCRPYIARCKTIFSLACRLNRLLDFVIA